MGMRIKRHFLGHLLKNRRRLFGCDLWIDDLQGGIDIVRRCAGQRFALETHPLAGPRVLKDTQINLAVRWRHHQVPVKCGFPGREGQIQIEVFAWVPASVLISG